MAVFEDDLGAWHEQGCSDPACDGCADEDQPKAAAIAAADLLGLYQPNVPRGNLLSDVYRRGENAMVSRLLVQLQLLDKPAVVREFRRLDDEAYARTQGTIERLERADRSTAREGYCPHGVLNEWSCADCVPDPAQNDKEADRG